MQKHAGGDRLVRMKQAGKEKLPMADLDALMVRMNDAYHLDENAAVEEQLGAVTLGGGAKARVRETARKLVETVRAKRSLFGGLDSFLQEFGLTTKEGVALMCLAEALLRIPDTQTADLLIRDKIGGADWNQHLGKGPDLFVNASTWALMLTGKVISDVETEGGSLVSRMGEPVIRKAMLHAMKIMGQQFVMGRTIEEALKRSEEAEKTGYRHSFDMLGEGARTAEDAERYFENYEMAINAIGRAAAGRGVNESPGISIKLSALHPRYEYAQRHLCVPALSEKLLALAEKCAHYNIGLTVDAEEAHRLEMSLDIIANVFPDPTLKGWDGFGLALQAYQKRAGRALDWLIALAEQNHRRMMVRLVKGAYWDSEVKYAQVNGLPGYPVFTRKNATDVSYLACAAKMMERRDVLYPMFATHNAYTVAAVIELAGKNKGDFEFQRLHGMGEPLYHQITGFDVDGKYPCRVYAPVGSHQDLLPYLVRRLLENGANTSFVNRLQNDKVPMDDILADPVEYMAKLESKPHPKIPLPADIYGKRKNSRGVEFANSNVSAPFLRDIASFSSKQYTVSPSLRPAGAGGEKILNPANPADMVGTVSMATQDDMALALKTAHGAWPSWNAMPADARAACLERAADLMEQNYAELMSLCVREAGKTLPDAVAEIREAVDFCRYYAAEGRKHFGAPLELPGPTGESNTLSLQGRGVFLCISPWNFPLAIFMGQVSAALMAGNAVIAKPAEQTNIIAQKAVELLHKAGVPKEALVFLPAAGDLVGEMLVPDGRVAGVCFTGSTEVAQIINRALAAREGAIATLIAETGGQNAMIVDSSALPEQIIDDVITSAFRSAGQRCSALRALFVPEGIADKVIAMLNGACEELILGNPAELATDIGPVIDAAALGRLEKHAAHMDREAKLLAEVKKTAACAHGHFFAPRAYEIQSLGQLTHEVFGPVLHIIRYKAEELDKVIDQINATGYGLTFGIHTRIDHQMRAACARVNAGNCYVNRSMIGAVVGVQPFGGQGLSGTGPKAGGPHYLPRFAAEKTVSINTTASGGNTTLVSLQEE
jgi:RHH-type proline utilization regulon transcriptional repressor/proline dehydrogenase/delta 1-pyrroline-5-carboxylate dehydrogenase